MRLLSGLLFFSNLKNGHGCSTTSFAFIVVQGCSEHCRGHTKSKEFEHCRIISRLMLLGGRVAPRAGPLRIRMEHDVVCQRRGPVVGLDHCGHDGPVGFGVRTGRQGALLFGCSLLALMLAACCDLGCQCQQVEAAVIIASWLCGSVFALGPAGIAGSQRGVGWSCSHCSMVLPRCCNALEASADDYAMGFAVGLPACICLVLLQVHGLQQRSWPVVCASLGAVIWRKWG